MPRNNYLDSADGNSNSSSSYNLRSSGGGKYGAGGAAGTMNGSLRGSKDFNKQSQSNALGGSAAGGGAAGGGTNSSTTTLRQSQMMESPRSKAHYKDFLAEFREKEKESVTEALKVADVAAATASDSIRWKIHLEQADLAKRHNLMQEV